MKNYLSDDDIEAVIEREYYHVPPHTAHTICVLTLKNGFTVIGESACVDRSNFSVKVGKIHAREDAVNKIWMLEAYVLRNTLNINS